MYFTALPAASYIALSAMSIIALAVTFQSGLRPVTCVALRSGRIFSWITRFVFRNRGHHLRILIRFIEELKFKCDIVSVVSQYVPLVKKGNRYFCCCPFHNEKTPSMCVNTQGQFYHCFGCGASGDVITFVMEMESLGYVDAVKLLAERAGMELPEYKADAEYKKKKDRQDTLKELMKDAARYYQRGITEEICTRFGLGLSLGYDQLQGYLRRKGYAAADLRDCGLATGDKLTDAFHGRVIVPIMNGMGDVIAFGGRIYRGEQDVAKYKNSTNTVLFDKSRCVYGINFVKREKRRGNGFKNLILVEGYMDVISLAAAGYFNVVAGMGTALTPQQAREIRKLTDTVYVCYDGDAAGRKAAVRNVEPLIAEGLDVRVVSLAEGLDPDDTIRQEGADGFRKRLEEALPVMEYKLKLCADAYEMGSADGRAKYVRAALKVLAEVQNAAEREVYLGIVSSKSGVSVNTLKETLVGVRPAPAVKREEDAARPRENRLVAAARFVLNAILAREEHASASDVEPEWMPLPEQAEILAFVRAHPEKKTGDLFPDGVGGGELNEVLNAERDLSSREKERQYYSDCVALLSGAYDSARISELKERFKQLSDAEERRSVLKEIQRLQKKAQKKTDQKHSQEARWTESNF